MPTKFSTKNTELITSQVSCEISLLKGHINLPAINSENRKTKLFTIRLNVRTTLIKDERDSKRNRIAKQTHL